ncbi:MAG: hypothetical protein HQK83_20015 [Fibrobacteria bacterium]|nr:hypothetical protein [Fibrobacteria bacterium]
MIISPMIVAATILGIQGGSNNLSEKLITNLIMPLKVAAAFSLSFVLLSGLVGADIPMDKFVQFVDAKASMDQLLGGDNMFGLLWKLAVIMIFWKSAFWAIEGSEAQFITDKIKGGAEAAGQFMLEAATIDRPIIPMGNGGKASLSDALGLMGAWKQTAENKQQERRDDIYKDIIPGYGAVADANNALRDAAGELKNAKDSGSKQSEAEAISRGIANAGGHKAVKSPEWDRFIKNSSLSEAKQKELKEAIEDSSGNSSKINEAIRNAFGGEINTGRLQTDYNKKAGSGGKESGPEGQTTSVQYTDASNNTQTDVNYNPSYIQDSSTSIRRGVEEGLKEAKKSNADQEELKRAAASLGQFLDKAGTKEKERLKLFIEGDKEMTQHNAENLAAQIAADMNAKLPENKQVNPTELSAIVKVLLEEDFKRKNAKPPEAENSDAGAKKDTGGTNNLN